MIKLQYSTHIVYYAISTHTHFLLGASNLLIANCLCYSEDKVELVKQKSESVKTDAGKFLWNYYS